MNTESRKSYLFLKRIGCGFRLTQGECPGVGPSHGGLPIFELSLTLNKVFFSF